VVAALPDKTRSRKIVLVGGCRIATAPAMFGCFDLISFIAADRYRFRYDSCAYQSPKIF
jgi:hypothetical protein